MGFELFLFEVINPIASATWSQGQASISLNFNGCELLDLAKDSSPPPALTWGAPIPITAWLTPTYLCGGPTPTQANTCTRYCASGWGCEPWVVKARYSWVPVLDPKTSAQHPYFLVVEWREATFKLPAEQSVNLTLTVLRPNLTCGPLESPASWASTTPGLIRTPW